MWSSSSGPAAAVAISAVLCLLKNLQARKELLDNLETDFDRELYQLAMSRVRLVVAAHTWEAFHLTALDGVPPAEAATRLEMSVGAVYQREAMSRADCGKAWPG